MHSWAGILTALPRDYRPGHYQTGAWVGQYRNALARRDLNWWSTIDSILSTRPSQAGCASCVRTSSWPNSQANRHVPLAQWKFACLLCITYNFATRHVPPDRWSLCCSTWTGGWWYSCGIEWWDQLEKRSNGPIGVIKIIDWHTTERRLKDAPPEFILWNVLYCGMLWLLKWLHNYAFKLPIYIYTINN